MQEREGSSYLKNCKPLIFSCKLQICNAIRDFQKGLFPISRQVLTNWELPNWTKTKTKYKLSTISNRIPPKFVTSFVTIILWVDYEVQIRFNTSSALNQVEW